MASFPVSDGPHNDDWKALLRPCFAVIDEVIQDHGVAFPIQIGGGSMLLRRYRHRKSKDLDLFVTDTQLARWCSPRFNETAADLFPDYGEDAVMTKLIIGMQEIDIIAAAPIVLEGAVDEAEFEGRTLLIERPREILAKKVAYRGRLFQPRDIFDLACIAEAEPDEVAAVLPWLSLAHAIDLEARLAELAPILGAELANKVEPYAEFEHLRDSCLDIAAGVVRSWKENLTPAVEIPPHPTGYRVLFSRDGRSVVIKEVDPDTGRAGKLSNPLGPAVVSVDAGPEWYIGGVKLSEREWREQAAKVAARMRGPTQ